VGPAAPQRPLASLLGPPLLLALAGLAPLSGSAVVPLGRHLPSVAEVLPPPKSVPGTLVE